MTAGVQQSAVEVSFERMQAMAEKLAQALRKGDVVTLRGDVGAGKTSFARAAIKALAGQATEVLSPTFTLMQSYDVTVQGAAATLWHLDLYRIKNSAEAEMLGLEELWPQLLIIEWPEVIEPHLPSARLDITFSNGSSQDTRLVTLSGAEKWQDIIKEITHVGTHAA